MIDSLLKMLADPACETLTRQLAASNISAAFSAVDKRNRMLHAMLKMVAGGMLLDDPCRPLVVAVLEKCE